MAVSVSSSPRERSLLAPSLSALIQACILHQDDLCAEEVPIIRNRADAVCVRSQDATLVCLELKENNWSRVNQQAKRHGAWAHRTYLAMGAKSIPAEYHALYATLKIGVVLATSEPPDIIRRSARVSPSSRHLVRAVRAYVRAHGRPLSELL